MRVLLIDDNLYDRRAIRRLTRRLNLELSLEEAIDVASAMQLLAVEAFDCLLVDYQLPDGNGVELLKTLMASNADGPVPAIMLTGQPTDDLAKEVMATGLVDFMSKDGLNADVLERALRNAMIKRQGRLVFDDAGQPSSQPPSGHDALAGILAATRILYQSEAVRAALELDADAKDALDRIDAAARVGSDRKSPSRRKPAA